MKNYQQTPKQRNHEMRKQMASNKAMLAHSKPHKIFATNFEGYKPRKNMRGEWSYMWRFSNTVLDHGGKL